MTRSVLDDMNAAYPEDATEISAGVRSGRVSAVETIERARARHEAQSDLNAFTHESWAAAERAAVELDRRRRAGDDVGPLAGVPVSVKDVIAVAGLPITAGSRALMGTTARATATAVRRLQDAGAIVVGKSNCPEFAFGVTCESPLQGRTLNPRFPDVTPGGSSGGDAALLAAGITALGIGTDFGGSLRWPAQCTGTVSIRPTAGFVPTAGQVPAAGGDVGATDRLVDVSPGMQGRLQVVGPLARSIRDLRTALAVMAGRAADSVDVGDFDPSALRVAWSDGGALGPVRREVSDRVAEVAEAAAGRGATAIERPRLFEGCLPAYNALRAVDPMRDHAAVVAGREHLLLPENLQTIRASLVTTPAELAAAELAAADSARAALRIFDEVDVVLLPVAGGPACDHDGTLAVDGVVVRGWELMGACRAVTLTGAPAVSVPVGRSEEGLPLSLQVVCAPGRDGRALAVAEWLASMCDAG